MTQHILTLTSYLQTPFESALSSLKTFFKAVYAKCEIAQMQRAISMVRKETMKYKAYRDTYNELSSLSDRELRDIGISRSDIHYIALKAHYETL